MLCRYESLWMDFHFHTDSLCCQFRSLLAPTGRHRAHVKSSKGVRSRRKRKRNARKAAAQGQLQSAADVVLSPPGIQAFLTVGLNSITRHLEQLASLSVPFVLAVPPGNDSPAPSKAPGDPSLKHMDVMFLPHSPEQMIYAHLPTLSLAASKTHPDRPRTRLVSLKDKDSQIRMAKAMGLPQVGVVGILEGAPGAGPLVEYVTNHLKQVKVPWLCESLDYQGLKVEVTEGQSKKHAIE